MSNEAPLTPWQAQQREKLASLKGKQAADDSVDAVIAKKKSKKKTKAS